MSNPYSMDPGGNRCWRYRVLDIHVFINGSWKYQDAVVEALEGAASVLESLEVRMEFAIKPSIVIITKYLFYTVWR